jgi:predicted phage-related endonuclease
MNNQAIGRRGFIGGSDARIILGNDEDKLIRLWREKRSEAEPADLSGNLVVQLGVATEDLNRRWYEARSGNEISDIQRHLRHPAIGWMRATLDGRIKVTGAIFEAKFMLPWTFSEEAATQKHMAQLQHNMWVANTKSAVLSIITGGGKWCEIRVAADPMYQHLLLVAEKKFWRCVQSGERPCIFGLDPPPPRIEAVNVVDMNGSNAWAEFSALYQRTSSAHQAHETAKAELKKLIPADAREAIGHGVRAKRSRTGSVSFERSERGNQNASLE